MKKNLRKLLALSSIIICSVVGFFAFAAGENGKINISKTATKIYDEVNSDNLQYGRKAKVNLTVDANSYNETTTTSKKLDIVLIFDTSGSMQKGEPTRLSEAKTAATSFINSILGDNKDGAVKLGLVEFGTDVKQTSGMTDSATTALGYLTNMSADGGTNLQAAIKSAHTLLDGQKRSDAKQVIIVLTDGIPTFFTYNNERFGTGDSDDTVCLNNRCSKKKKPSEAAKEELDSLKASYSTADVYTITFGDESAAATTLANINPAHENPLYENSTALDGETLKKKFQEIINNQIDVIGTNSIVKDTIPAYFKLTDTSKQELIAKGITVVENSDGTTTLTWNIGDIKANNKLSLTYEVVANDDYHGSMYTNESAILSTTVADENPYYTNTNQNLTFETPTVEIPAITNDDHYSNNPTYTTYEENITNATSILTNDINKNILNDKIDENTSVKTTDTIIIKENENTIKNADGSYSIYKDSKLQGKLYMHEDGTFDFVKEEGITGIITFEYYIKSIINSHQETEEVYSNTSTVTLNIKERSKTKVSGTKTWSDFNNQDGLRPESITVRLYADGKEIESKTVSANNNWKYSFDNLYVYEKGKENTTKIVYTIKEDSVDGYTTTINGNDITNTHKIIKTEVSGTKTWTDNNNQDGLRPESITVRLYANGKEIESQKKTVTASNNWKYSFDNLDKYQNGKEIVYTVSEDSVDGYTTTIKGNDITNKHEIIKTEVSGTKMWTDNNNQDGKRPESITVRLYADGSEVTSKEVKATDNWKYSFTDLDKYKDGKEIVYTISEDSVDGYTTTINGNDITNTHDIIKTEVSGTKTWDDFNNQDGKRPTSITVRLYADGSEVKSKEVTATDDWKYSFDNLDKYQNGKEIVYTINEDSVDGYTTTISGNDITNKHDKELININGAKKWVDSNNIEGFRPDKITVKLYANGAYAGSKEVTASNNWNYSFTKLDKYENGKEIDYTVKEETVDHYETSYDENNKYIVVNTHTPRLIEVSGTKTWNDEANIYGRPESITVHLTGKIGDQTVVTKDMTVTSSNNWSYSFTDLAEYQNGKLIVYTVSEDAVKDYDTTINNYNITNTYNPELININGTKIWDDVNNQDGKRPDSITIKLLANGNEVATTTTTEANNWEYSFDNIVKYANGSLIEYTVLEETVSGYDTKITDYTITNTYTPEKVSFNVTKLWNDYNNNDGIRPESITVRLYANGVEVAQKVISEDNNWTYSFADFDKYANGNLINYEVVEDVVKGYTTDVIQNNEEDNASEIVITNTHEKESADITVVKNWDDSNNQDGKRPEQINVNLYADGTFIKTIILNQSTDWKYIFSNLDKYKDGKLIEYSVLEDEVDNYITFYDGYTITNVFKATGSTSGYSEIVPPKTGNTTTNDVNLLYLIIITMVILLFPVINLAKES